MAKALLQRRRKTLKHGWHMLRNRRSMWQMLGDTLRGRYKMSIFTIAVTILALAYVIFPFDLIPDYIPVLGWIDDIVVLYLLLFAFVRETNRYNRHKVVARRGQ